MAIECDLEQLTMTLSVSSTIPEIKTVDGFKNDFFGKQMNNSRLPGPFGKLPGTSQTISIDPRK